MGDFQQLQPIDGEALLQEALDRNIESGRLRKIVLEQHATARCTDGKMLDFLNWIRTHQPSRALLVNFFNGRKLSRSLERAVSQSMALERSEKRKFTFLTVTNKGAASLNKARVSLQFPQAERLAATHSVPVDPAQCTQPLVFLKGMQVRLTKNLDKDRGFVNGALGTIVMVLNRQTFVVETEEGVHLLVHAVCDNGKPFVPAVYGYAMTIRRGQGTTLELAGLHFDRRRADRGYAYVGASRVRRKKDVYHFGTIRRTDWLPVGGDVRGDDAEQMYPSALSASSDDEYERSSSGDDPDSNEYDSRDERESNAFDGQDSDDEDAHISAAFRKHTAVGEAEHDDSDDDSDHRSTAFKKYGKASSSVDPDYAYFS